MAFILGLIVGLCIGVFAMNSKFKKQLKLMEQAAPVTPEAEVKTFTAENLVNAPDTEEK